MSNFLGELCLTLKRDYDALVVSYNEQVQTTLMWKKSHDDHVIEIQQLKAKRDEAILKNNEVVKKYKELKEKTERQEALSLAAINHLQDKYDDLVKEYKLTIAECETLEKKKAPKKKQVSSGTSPRSAAS